MNDEAKASAITSSPAQPAGTAESGAGPVLDPITALSALANEWRWEMVWRMASGEELIATDLARELGRDFDGVSKHLRVLRDAGVVDARVGEDRRLTVFFIPAAFRPEPGVLDYGFCRLRRSAGAPAVAKG